MASNINENHHLVSSQSNADFEEDLYHLSSEEEINYSRKSSTSDASSIRPMTPGMSRNVASSLSLIKGSEEIYEPERMNLLPSESHQTKVSEYSNYNDPERSSTKQVFPYISCLPFENNAVFCFILSAWDNIVGPQSIYVWKKKALPNLKNFEDLVTYENFNVTPPGLKIKQKRRSSLGLGLYTDQRRLSIAEEVTDVSPSPPNQDPERFHRSLGTRSSVNEKSSDLHKSMSNIHISEATTSDSHLNVNKSSNKDQRRPSVGVEAITEGVDNIENYSPNNNQRKKSTFTLKNAKKLIGIKETTKTSTDNTSKISIKTSSYKPTPLHQQNSVNLFTQDSSVDESIPSNSRAIPKIHLEQESVSKSKREENQDWSQRRSTLNLASVVRYVTEHSVGVGELGRSHEQLTSSMLVVPQHSIIVISARFSVVEDGLGVPYCLSLVIPFEEKDNILPLQEFITHSLLRSAAIARLLITKNGLEGGSIIQNRLVDLCEILVALRKASLDQYPLAPAGKPPEDRKFAELMLTSHLQTMGTTVVIGDSPNMANKVVMWLGQFSRQEDLHISRLCLSFAQWPYQPGLAIQGILKDSTGEVNISSQDLLMSDRPLTVVDLTKGTVRQTQHSTISSTTFRQQLLALWYDLPDPGAPSQSLFGPVKSVSPLVKQFLHDQDRLGACSVEIQKGFTAAFLRYLQYMAVALITWVKNEWLPKRKHSLYSSLKQALMSVFMLNEADLQVILAHGDYLQPGFYALVIS